MKKCLYSHIFHCHVICCRSTGTCITWGATGAPSPAAPPTTWPGPISWTQTQVHLAPESCTTNQLIFRVTVFTELPLFARIPQWQTKRSLSFQKVLNEWDSNSGCWVLNSECSWCRALRGRGVRRLRVRGDSHGRRQVLLPPQEAAGLGQVRITTKTNLHKVVFAQE